MSKIKIILILISLILISIFILKFYFKNNPTPTNTVILISGLGDDIPANTLLISHWQKQGIKIIVFDTRWKSDEKYEDKLNRLLTLIDNESTPTQKPSLLGISAGGSLALNAFNYRKDKVNKVITICSRLRLGQLNGFRGSTARTKGYLSFAESITKAEDLEKTLSNDDRQRIMTVTAQFGDELVPKNTSTITGAHNIFVPTIEHALSISASLTIFSEPLTNFVKNQNPTPVHPLSIDNLATRQFPPQVLKVERQVTKNSQVVSYQSDDLKLYALMITPSGIPPSTGWPVVIVNHGHIPPQEYSVTRSYINTSNYFASQGFLVLKPDYRGHDQSEGESSGRLLARSEYAVDILNLLSTINSIPNANPNKIFIYGHSMGGEVTLQVLEVNPKITAATLWGPSVTTLPDMVTHFVNKNRPSPGQVETFQNQYQEFAKKYSLSQITSIENLDKISTPVNIHHATTDESVPYVWGTTLVDKLKAGGKTVNFYSYPGDNHDIAKNFGKALSIDAAFFKSFL